MAHRLFAGARAPGNSSRFVLLYESDGPCMVDINVPTPPGLGREMWDWGTPLPGSLRLSWLILATFLSHDIANCLAHDYLREVLSQMPLRGFAIYDEAVERWLAGWVIRHANEFTRRKGEGADHVLPF